MFKQELVQNPKACPVRPYWDPLLRRDVHARVDLIKRLHRVGIVEFRKKIKCSVGIFFVKKKSPDWIRMVIDARLTNFRHRTPPVARLGSGDNFTQLDLHGESLDHFWGLLVISTLGTGMNWMSVIAFTNSRFPLWLNGLAWIFRKMLISGHNMALTSPGFGMTTQRQNWRLAVEKLFIRLSLQWLWDGVGLCI